MMNKKKKLLLNIDIIISSIAMFILVGVTFIGVIMRYVVGNPFGWIEEIQAALILWVVFLAGGAAYRTANHSSIEIVYELFPTKIQKLIQLLIGITVTLVLGYLCYTSCRYFQFFMRTGRSTSVLHIPYILIYSIVPISCILQIFNYFLVNIFGYNDEIVQLTEEDGNNE